MRKNLMLCGVGGQGIVLTSKLIAATAMEKDIPVMSAETIGMAQKGGSVFSFLRLGEGLYGPMYRKGSADIMIAFEPAEAVRMLPYLKKGGRIILNTHPVMPVTSTLGGVPYHPEEMTDCLKSHDCELTMVDGESACRTLGSPKVLNMIMLGLAVRSGVLPFTIEEIESTMLKTVRPQFFEINSRALLFDPSR